MSSNLDVLNLRGLLAIPVGMLSRQLDIMTGVSGKV